MYESEIYNKSIKESVPEDILNNFRDTHATIELRSLLHWSEHCTECAMPSCFKTCDFYTPRIDGKCQRFVKGIEIINLSSKNDRDASSHLLKVYFKNWGVLSSQGNNELYTLLDCNKYEKRDLIIASFIHMLFPPFVKKKFAQKRYSIKKKHIIKTQNKSELIPDAFLIEIYNPSTTLINVTLTIRNDDERYRKIPFQFRLVLKGGYNKESIPFEEIDKRIKSGLPYRISITPEHITPDIPLYFGITEFVRYYKNSESAKKSDKIKCVVWDLDNTIWDGVLVENGFKNLQLKENIRETLSAIENRGIINSIASKNDFSPAIEAIKHFGLDEFFLFPKISWGPKSIAIKEIALDLNINLNTFLFVDDSPFERGEVNNALPQVRVTEKLEHQDILNMSEFQVPITDESKKRKQFYINESERKDESSSFDGDYLDFLRSCKIELEISRLSVGHFTRVYELTQRTNQMNFSGNHYQKEDIQKIAEDKDIDAYVLKCTDKYGEYGVIGFAVIKKSENRLIDLMFSCRIQSKRVEHAFITFCLNRYLVYDDFLITYKLTDKNRFSAQVFTDFDFDPDESNGNIKKLRFPKTKEVPDDHIINVKTD